MTKLEELIKKLCSNGIVKVPLWSVTIWDRRFNAVERAKQPKVINYPYLLAAKLFALEEKDGNVFLLSTGEQTGWTTEERAGDSLCEGEVVTMPWGKSRAVTDCIKYYKGKFVTADNRIMTSNDTQRLSNKYLYYWFMSVGNEVDTFYRGSGIKHPDMAKVLDMQIPVPPLPVQEEIVRILDSFTELTAELTARKKQYEYYRERWLTTISNEQIAMCNLGDICDVSAGSDAPKDDMSIEKTETHCVPIISNGIGENAIYGYTSSPKITVPAVTVAARGTIGYAEYRDYPYYPIIRLLSVIPKDSNVLYTKYLYYTTMTKSIGL